MLAGNSRGGGMKDFTDVETCLGNLNARCDHIPMWWRDKLAEASDAFAQLQPYEYPNRCHIADLAPHFYLRKVIPVLLLVSYVKPLDNKQVRRHVQ